MHTPLFSSIYAPCVTAAYMVDDDIHLDGMLFVPVKPLTKKPIRTLLLCDNLSLAWEVSFVAAAYCRPVRKTWQLTGMRRLF